MFPVRRCRLVKEDGQIYALALIATGDTEALAVTRAEAGLIRALDGKTDPHDLEDCSLTDVEISRLLRRLKQRDLIAVGRLRLRPFSVLYTLWFAGCRRVSDRTRMVCLLVTLLLAVCCIPAFVIGALTAHREMGFSFLWTGDFGCGAITGLAFGLLLHELSHAASCLSFGGRFYGAGIGLLFLMPCAFADIDFAKVKSRWARAEIILAGVQANLLVSGAAFWMTQFGYGWFWYAFGVQNIILAILNLSSLFAGLDGAKGLRLLLGIESESIVDLLLDRRKRRQLRKKGSLGKACAAAAGILALSNVGLALLFVLEIKAVFM